MKHGAASRLFDAPGIGAFMKSVVTALAACGAVALSSPALAQSVVPGVYNTGANASGTAVLSPGDTDSHYTVQAPGATTAVDATVANPNSGWVGASDSAWLGDGWSDPAPVGDFTYTTVFSLAGYDPATAVLNGLIAADNSANVYLNGTLIGTAANGYSDFSAFTATTGFLAGTNTLRIVDNNQGGPYGINISGLSITANVLSGVPEPATWAMMLLGFGAIGFTMRRTHAKAVATA